MEVKCKTCDGKGKVWAPDIGGGDEWATCYTCGGKGAITEDGRCPLCGKEMLKGETHGVGLCP